MNNWIPKNKIVKFAEALALFSMILYFIGLFLVINKIKAVENFYHGAESESFKEEKFLVIKSIAESNKESIQILRDFFIQKGDEVKFIEKIEETARASSLKFEISSIDVKANQTNSFKEDVSVKMKIEGTWSSIIYFIDKLNKIPFGVSIEKVSLGAPVAGEWSGSIDFIIFREK